MGSHDPDPGRGQSRRGFLGAAGLIGVGAAAMRGRLLPGDRSASDRAGAQGLPNSSRGTLVTVQNLTFGTSEPWRPVSIFVNHL
jgi:hypothetical protein